MGKPSALLLLLAVAASQVDFSLSAVTELNFTDCPINYYGRNYTALTVEQTPNVSTALCFKGSNGSDCIHVSNGGSDTATMVVIGGTTNITFNLPSIKSVSQCRLILTFKENKTGSIKNYIFLYQAGQQAAVYLGPQFSLPTISVNMTVDNSTVDSVLKDKMTFYLDISGCRNQNAGFKTGEIMFNSSETCSQLVCSVESSGVSVSTCGSEESCIGNNMCVKPADVCTVTASSIIDFSSRVHSVPDRCVYSLMKPLGSSAFNLLAGFRERRRQDVAFLDHLILSLNGSSVKIYLEQGGRVRDGQQTLTLNATGQVVHGVELSKNQTGVTAKIPSINATVFFDGNTAHVTGHFGAMEGLCGNPANSSQNFTLSAAKSSNDSAASCETLHKQTADSSINCTRTTEYCNLIKQAPFTVCHNHSDPEPFVTACTDTLCKYPAVDGLNKCQFLEAYAESCRLKVTITVENWRSNASCSAVPQASCQDQDCSAHEFCGEKLGSTSCLCRAIFAAKYNSTNSLGEPTVCTQNSATLTLAGCLLTDKGIDYSALHLKDQNCTGHIDSKTHMVTFSFNSSNTCGAEVMKNNSQVLYKNTVMMANASGIITRNDQVEIDFSCLYAVPEVKSVSFKIKDSSVVKQIVSGVWNYTVTMNAYNDSGHKNLVNANTEVGLNQKIWVELKTDGLDNNIVTVVTDSCWASNDSSPNGTLRYDLVKNGCPNAADKTVMMEGNGVGTSNGFSFNMFEFSGKTGDIYLHCKLELCLTQSNACAPSCGGLRKRRSLRSKYADGNPALISMTWTK
ncbi:uncharacterized protein LOC127378337 [Dicentrarchus labrax]|nr:uncharacterized protein LOC127378337 [Dicentrarchus labrax]